MKTGENDIKKGTEALAENESIYLMHAPCYAYAHARGRRVA